MIRLHSRGRYWPGQVITFIMEMLMTTKTIMLMMTNTVMLMMTTMMKMNLKR